ncbi:DUF1540 domain-containing protein [Alkalibaculum bacchi]|uniref:DUF1540 domain-containing protein n=1 Tax=Alkalibaculum bacchi TaxID=645887 RepID=UPI0026EC6AC8|nr:DUF1540 domain-containing protein [Alkalibaculum bacchi]
MKINNSIGCTVEECKYHAKNQDYCSLDKIQVTKNAAQARNQKETDCHSFESELR